MLSSSWRDGVWSWLTLIPSSMDLGWSEQFQAASYRACLARRNQLRDNVSPDPSPPLENPAPDAHRSASCSERCAPGFFAASECSRPTRRTAKQRCGAAHASRAAPSRRSASDRNRRTSSVSRKSSCDGGAGGRSSPLAGFCSIMPARTAHDSTGDSAISVVRTVPAEYCRRSASRALAMCSAESPLSGSRPNCGASRVDQAAVAGWQSEAGRCSRLLGGAPASNRPTDGRPDGPSGNFAGDTIAAVQARNSRRGIAVLLRRF